MAVQAFLQIATSRLVLEIVLITPVWIITSFRGANINLQYAFDRGSCSNARKAIAWMDPAYVAQQRASNKSISLKHPQDAGFALKPDQSPTIKPFCLVQKTLLPSESNLEEN